MRFAAFLWLLVFVEPTWTLAASEVDKFRADGSTTYCKLSRGAPTRPFNSLSPESRGKCPVAISMKASVRSYTSVTTIVDVEWNITVNPARSSELFPVDIFENKITISDSVVACTVESNCESPDDVINSRAINISEGMYDSFVDVRNVSPMALLTYRLRLPPKGTYVIVADVPVTTEDMGLVHNYAFQRVRATADVERPPGTVKPAPIDISTLEIPADEEWVLLTPTPSPVTTTPSPTQDPHSENRATEVNAQDAAKDSGVSHGNASNVVVIFVLAVAALIAATMYFIMARRPKRQAMEPSGNIQINAFANFSMGTRNCRSRSFIR